MSGTDELKKHLWKNMEEGPYVMIGLEGGGHSEPLTVQLDKDQADRLYFFIGKDNRMARGGKAMAQFVSKGQDFFACLSGLARIDNDRAIIDKLWSNEAESWFSGGKNDPNLALLRFDIEDAELWETDISLSGRLKMLFGGKINTGEEGSHARVGTTVIKE